MEQRDSFFAFLQHSKMKLQLLFSFLNGYLPATDVMIFKIVSLKNPAKILALLLQKFHQNISI
jgi:hypothetical protein